MQKSVYAESIDSDVIIARRRGTRSLRLTLRGDGTIRLSVPYGVSDAQAQKFIRDKADWIKSHHTPSITLHEGAHIGKSWRLHFEQTAGDTTKTRLAKNTIIIKLANGARPADPDVQQTTKKACERALQKEAANLLPQRLEMLASKHSIDYSSCSVKKLRSRWGSCDSRKNITLNIYLSQLPWELIDYVILHELAHTYHQHHQADFWQYLETLLPEWKALRKELKSKPTDIMPTAY